MNNISLKAYLRERGRDRIFIGILSVFAALLIASAVYWIVEGSLRNTLMFFGFILFAPLLMLFEWKLGFRSGCIFTVAVLFIALGSILGSCFDMYNYIPFFDTLLHGLSGVLFAAFGFTLAERLFGKRKSRAHLVGCIAFAVCFSLAIAVAWELFEYACTVFAGFDMMEDSYVDRINSYLLAGTHNSSVVLEDIKETVIYYGNGQTYTVSGYLDLGLIDTLTDMLICTVGAVAFAVVSGLSDAFFPSFNRSLIPSVLWGDEE